jgi:hypothetical protein
MKSFQFPSVLCIFCLCLLGGCSPHALVERFADEEMTALALERIEALRLGDGTETWAELDPAVQPNASENLLAQMAEAFPDNAFSKRSFISYKHSTTTDKDLYNFVVEYEIDGTYWIADITLNKTDDRVTTYGIYLDRKENSALSAPQLDFSQVGPLHLLILTAVVVLPLASIVSIVVCLCTRGLKRKWLWCLFMLLGVTTIELNWATGAWQRNPFSFQILSAGASAINGGPWIFKISLPLGLLFFWEKRLKLRREAKAASGESPSPPPAENPNNSNPPTPPS